MLNKFKNLFTLQRTSLAVGVLGVSLQLFVLNPWHSKISIQLNSLENKIGKIGKLENTNKINNNKDVNKDRNKN